MIEDEAIILDTLKFIRREIKGKKYINITTTLWWNFDIEKQEQLTRLMLTIDGGLIGLNDYDLWEFKLNAPSLFFINEGEKKLERDFLKFVSRQPDIEWFMVNHFIKPDPRSTDTKNETDNGVNFLKGLQGKGLISYNKDLLSFINFWFEDTKKTTKRWFNSSHTPILVELTDLGRNHLFLEDETRSIGRPTEIESAIPPKPSGGIHYHINNPTNSIIGIGDNNKQSFKAHDIRSTNNDSGRPGMSVTMKWILATLSTIVGGLIVWWLTKQ